MVGNTDKDCRDECGQRPPYERHSFPIRNPAHSHTVQLLETLCPWPPEAAWDLSRSSHQVSDSASKTIHFWQAARIGEKCPVFASGGRLVSRIVLAGRVIVISPAEPAH